MRQGRLEDVAEPLKVQKSNPAEYVYTRPVVEALLEGFFDGLGDTEQRMDLVAGLKRIGPKYANVLVAHALGIPTKAIAKRLDVTRKSIWVWRRDGMHRLLTVMNGGAK